MCWWRPRKERDVGRLYFYGVGYSGGGVLGRADGLFVFAACGGGRADLRPVALYFFATGATGRAPTIILTAFGVGVIGLVDNLLHLILVGKDTKMPDYVVLISTLGGMSLLGINGFVIGPVIAALFMATWDIFAAKKTVAVRHHPRVQQRADAAPIAPSAWVC